MPVELVELMATRGHQIENKLRAPHGFRDHWKTLAVFRRDCERNPHLNWTSVARYDLWLAEWDVASRTFESGSSDARAWAEPRLLAAVQGVVELLARVAVDLRTEERQGWN